MTDTTQTLPRWDMTVVYPGIDSPEFADGFEKVKASIDDLGALFDRHGIEKQEPRAIDNGTVAIFEQALERYNAVIEAQGTMSAYIQSFIATDSRDNLAQAKASELQRHSVRLWQLGTRFMAWIGSLNVEALIEQSEAAHEHAFTLRQDVIRASHMMSPPEEALAAELNVTGGSAWSKLHNNVTSQLSVPVEIDGKTEVRPMSIIRAMANEEDRDLRQRAYITELEGWKGAALPLAAALNSIKGEVNTLAKQRGWNSALDVAIFDSNIDRQTLDAMMQSAREAFPDFRRYLRAKARALGLQKLAWFDIFAPVGQSNKVWAYNEATDFIIQQFGTYSRKMSDFAARAFRENWIDAESRPGKRDGAFCMSLREDQSRVMVNYTPAYGGMSTLAHELGHGYHNMVRADRTALQRATPMTLAETASIFCETIVREAALKDADSAEQLFILEASLQESCQIVVDISSRFLFESRLFEARLHRELSIEELNTIMLEAQKETYGDGLDEGAMHPYMWAVKGHYYRTALSFYNFPYMFGLLFGLGLYALYQKDAEGFKTGYDELLASTGMADAATLAARFGIDIRTPDFWRSSLDIIRADIDRFEKLVG